ncbi:MAG: hypothetical protein PHN80_00285 [Hespellia sp.]|nr:hypothetical protein [Hespellia sp.]
MTFVINIVIINVIYLAAGNEIYHAAIDATYLTTRNWIDRTRTDATEMGGCLWEL